MVGEKLPCESFHYNMNRHQTQGQAQRCYRESHACSELWWLGRKTTNLETRLTNNKDLDGRFLCVECNLSFFGGKTTCFCYKHNDNVLVFIGWKLEQECISPFRIFLFFSGSAKFNNFQLVQKRMSNWWMKLEKKETWAVLLALYNCLL